MSFSAECAMSRNSLSFAIPSSGLICSRYWVEVSFRELLEQKYSPPLSLRDFEEYLLNVEYAPENLSFYLWLRSYEDQYRRWESKNGKVEGLNLPDELSETFNKAIEQYFDGGPLELNISAQAQLELSDSLLISSNPSIFKPVRFEVMEMLEQSKSRWLAMYSNSICFNRKTTTIIFGSILVLAFLSIHLAIYFYTPSKPARLIPVPLLWIGTTMILYSIERIYLSNYKFKKTKMIRDSKSWLPSLNMRGGALRERGGFFKMREARSTLKLPTVVQQSKRKRFQQKEEHLPTISSLITNASTTILILEGEGDVDSFMTKLPTVPSKAMNRSNWQEPTDWSPSEMEVRALNQESPSSTPSKKPKCSLEPSHLKILLRSSAMTLVVTIIWILVWFPLSPPFQ
ncbi:hypothetical protein PPACK8108_LOCUS10495 [Phakopsora pachyrhizi]|uniref:RGS domain-containing protein n=1 Tax=Phakopsora pachyrhizi TaxID=170000 RepID=A0AAV0B137_PHAPC|nr:hypothetical protein PPACK8108_LOCUS10495 [Phakopsora pachyrhizi]